MFAQLMEIPLDKFKDQTQNNNGMFKLNVVPDNYLYCDNNKSTLIVSEIPKLRE
jgi:hypothetical protein